MRPSCSAEKGSYKKEYKHFQLQERIRQRERGTVRVKGRESLESTWLGLEHTLQETGTNRVKDSLPSTAVRHTRCVNEKWSFFPGVK